MEYNKENFAHNCVTILQNLHKFYIETCDDKICMSSFSEHTTSKANEKTVFINMIYVVVATCIERSGHYADAFTTESIPAKLLFYFFLGQNEKMSIGQYFDNQSMLKVVNELIGQVKSMHVYKDLAYGTFNVSNVLSSKGYNVKACEYHELLSDLAKSVVYADDMVSDIEELWIKSLASTYKKLKPKSDSEMKELVDAIHNIKKNNNEDEVQSNGNVKISGLEDTQSSDIAVKPIDALSELIGLTTVKNDVKNLNNLLKMQKVRESRGLKFTPISYHCVFTGNPGTGKTTVARILANIYKDLGVLKKGHLVETDRSGLVAEYVGQTAVKTNEIIDKALDGVLFIDEAYSLVQGGQNDFGKEAISTLLKRMEDSRDRLIVILAGYSVEMSDFINSNSGLQSRFSRYINFPDYSADELLTIFDLQVKKNQYVLSSGARQKISKIILNECEIKDKNFGNARYVRNLFERIITQQANRLSLIDNLTNEMLMEIKEEDVILDKNLDYSTKITSAKIGFK